MYLPQKISILLTLIISVGLSQNTFCQNQEIEYVKKVTLKKGQIFKEKGILIKFIGFSDATPEDYNKSELDIKPKEEITIALKADIKFKGKHLNEVLHPLFLIGQSKEEEGGYSYKPINNIESKNKIISSQWLEIIPEKETCVFEITIFKPLKRKAVKT